MTLREHTAPLNMGMPIGSPWVLLLLLHSRSVLESVEASDATGAGESIECKTHSLPQPTYISHTPGFRSPSILNFKLSITIRNYFRTTVLLESILLLYHFHLSICTLITVHSHPPPYHLAHVLVLPIFPFSPHERLAHVSFMLSNLLFTK